MRKERAAWCRDDWRLVWRELMSVERELPRERVRMRVSWRARELVHRELTASQIKQSCAGALQHSVSLCSTKEVGLARAHRIGDSGNRSACSVESAASDSSICHHAISHTPAFVRGGPTAAGEGAALR